MMEELRGKVILVDRNDRKIGVESKLFAHQKGLLHRAFSVWIFNENGQTVLQKRADVKYHSPGKWSNSCCSHPQPGEDTESSAVARLQEELGFSTKIRHIGSFIYNLDVEQGLFEHEFDHVFVGQYDGVIYPNPDEVSDYEWYDLSTIATMIATEPAQFTPWFVYTFEEIISKIGDMKLTSFPVKAFSAA